MPLKAPDFDRWFAARDAYDPTLPPALRQKYGNALLALRQETASLWLPSGRLVAAGAVSYPDPEQYAFTATVPPGLYPVCALLAEYPGIAREYVAAVRLVVRDEPAASWEMAVRPGDDVSGIDEDGFVGNWVFGGMACFTDVQTIPELDNLNIPDTDGEPWGETLSLDVNDSPAGLATLTDPDRDETPVAVGFSTGEGGNGAYPTWVGRNVRGDITCFATDFMTRWWRPASEAPGGGE